MSAYLSFSNKLEQTSSNVALISDVLQTTTANILSKVDNGRLSDNETRRILATFGDLIRQHHAAARADVGRVLDVCTGLKTSIEEVCRSLQCAMHPKVSQAKQ